VEGAGGRAGSIVMESRRIACAKHVCYRVNMRARATSRRGMFTWPCAAWAVTSSVGGRTWVKKEGDMINLILMGGCNYTYTIEGEGRGAKSKSRDV
jgi:hypothetical protein